MTVMKKRAECATLFARPRFRRGLGRCWFLLLLYDRLRQVSPFVFMKAIPKMVFTIGGKEILELQDILRNLPGERN